jgi:hypothetical protein
MVIIWTPIKLICFIFCFVCFLVPLTELFRHTTYVLCLSCLLQLHLVVSDAELLPPFGRTLCSVRYWRYGGTSTFSIAKRTEA